MAARRELPPRTAQKRNVPPAVPDTIRCYFQDIDEIRKHQPLLKKDEEVRLARRIEAGRRASGRLDKGQNLSSLRKARLIILKEAGDKARKNFIEANLGLVVSVANKYAGYSNMTLEDLIQEGNIGLMKALERFDWRRGYKFSTYANWWIRQAITRALVDRGKIIRLPLHTHQDMSRYARARSSLVSDLGREPSMEETAEKMGVSLERVWELSFWESGEPMSLDTPVGQDGEGALADLIEDTSLPSSEKAIDELAAKEEARFILAGLSERERKILWMRHVDGMTLEQIAKKEGVTRERIRQIINRIEIRIRGAYRWSGNGRPV